MCKIEEKILKIADEFKNGQIMYRLNQPMSSVTTFSVGGRALLFVEPTSEEDILKVMEKIRAFQLPFYILGRGSNVLFPDETFEAVVIHLGKNFAEMKDLGGGMFSAKSGALLTDFSAFVAKSGYTGMEFAYGIPGTVGGGVYMNAGAYGGELKDVVSGIKYMTLEGEIKEIKRVPSMDPDENFSYRHSLFTDTTSTILETQVQLSKGVLEKIEYKMAEHMTARRTKQPLELPSAGSVFKRPIKGYASALIDECGLKGASVGGAQVSEKHAGFIVNQGGATAEDIRILVEKIQKIVFEKTGIPLECELKTAKPMNPW